MGQLEVAVIMLAPLGALDAPGHPRHRDGISVVHPALARVGLEWQRRLSSASLRGVGRDARRGARPLARRLGRTRKGGAGRPLGR